VSSEHERGPAPHGFVTTQWTRVLEARGDSSESQAALSDLCAAYYAPVFAFIRRGARDDEAARDLTQEFFRRLLARRGLAHLERERGRFRSFLLGAVKHFLCNVRDYDSAARRGHGQVVVPLAGDTEGSSGLQVPDLNAPSAEKLFDRQWALNCRNNTAGGGSYAGDLHQRRGARCIADDGGTCG